jgi:hypothetical protein
VPSSYKPRCYFQRNQYNAYSVNNITAKKGADGSVAIQFGGCDGKIPNCLPIIKRWNYTYGAPLSPATRTPRWHMEIPRGAARELSSMAFGQASDAGVSCAPRSTSSRSRSVLPNQTAWSV